mgnify:CR=1 FL=1
MKNTLVIYLVLQTFNLFSQYDVLDSTFNNNGKLLQVNESSNSICEDKDGKILVLGHDNSTGLYNIYIKRYHSNGMLDSSFDLDGVFYHDFNSDRDYGRAIKALPDGKYLICGQNSVGPYFRTFVLKLNNDGTFDNNFGVNGKVIITPSTDNSDAWDMFVSNTGSIYLAGYRGLNGNRKCAVWKLNINGQMNQNFGNSGELVFNFGGSSERLFGINVKNNKVAISGISDQYGIISLIDSNGNFDNNFNSNGQIRIKVNNTNTVFYDVLVANSSIVACGGINNGKYNSCIVSYKFDGSLNTNFGNSGVVINNSAYESFHDNLIENCKGEIFLGGYQNDGNKYSMFILKYNQNGALDLNFGNAGEITTRFNSTNGEAIEDMCLIGDNKIAFCGRINSGANTTNTGVGVVKIKKCSQELAIKIDFTSNFKIFPNPIIEKEFEIGLSNYNAFESIKIFNINGIEIKDFQYHVLGNAIKVNNFDTEKGLYFIVLAIDNKIIVKKVIKT